MVKFAMEWWKKHDSPQLFRIENWIHFRSQSSKGEFFVKFFEFRGQINIFTIEFRIQYNVYHVLFEKFDFVSTSLF